MKDASLLHLLTDSSALSRNPPEAEGLFIRAGVFLSALASVCVLTVLLLVLSVRHQRWQWIWMKSALDLYFRWKGVMHLNTNKAHGPKQTYQEIYKMCADVKWSVTDWWKLWKTSSTVVCSDGWMTLKITNMANERNSQGSGGVFVYLWWSYLSVFVPS